MATIVAARTPTIPAITSRSPTPPHLTLNTSLRGTPAAVPNKHIPICSPGPQPTAGLPSPPASPPNRTSIAESTSLLYPPDTDSLIFDSPRVYGISAATLAAAVDHVATQPLPDSKQVFPWLHGLHADNQIQLAFFIARRKSSRRVPRCLRGLTIVKAGGDMSYAKLKGAVAPEELIAKTRFGREAASFHDIDPRLGFSVRNFQIQTCKMATVSDIVVYGDDSTHKRDVGALARLLSQAQRAWRDKIDPEGFHLAQFNTFVVTDPFHVFETQHPELVATEFNGSMTGKVMDFSLQERIEMCSMSRASEIATNVWLGPTPDPSVIKAGFCSEPEYDLMIEAVDDAQTTDLQIMDNVETFLNASNAKYPNLPLSCPSSGSFVAQCWDPELERILELIKGLHRIANPASCTRKDTDGDSVMGEDKSPRKILIHCQDGYTETSLIALAYLMYADGIPVHEAWLRLHMDKKRNFFAYPTDLSLLKVMEARILEASPRSQALLTPPEPEWMKKMDGSLPSRVMPYLYLGNLTHANNPDLLREMGITQILSVGEPLTWSDQQRENWGYDKLMYIDKVQDNGVDPLTEEFDRCLQFIGSAKKDGATLVHCRVGVSRSATICIAEVMNELRLSFPRAYCFVRARRLNVIIQPHLRFSYELLKWEEYQAEKRGEPFRRELEWATIAGEIAAMNRPYSRQ